MSKGNVVALDVSKSQLGKLMASENIRIEHQKVQGPYFDVKNRILVLPIWSEMDADLYDLMIGHEVGHALFTPAEGWQHKIKKNGMAFKTFLNLVEDARIEKKMKRKYPGLKKPMYNGYTQLVDRGFFGLEMEEMKYLPFADRVNVYFKLGARADVSFTEKEMEIVNLIDNAETWDEVVNAAEELFKVAKEEKNNLSKILDDMVEQISDDETSGDSAEGSDSESDENNSDTNSTSNPSSGPSQKREELNKASEKVRKALENWTYEENLSSITENAMQENEKNLIDASAYPYLYLKMPDIKLEHWVVPSKIVHDLMHKGFSTRQIDGGESSYQKFMNLNKRYIDNMVKEFELRRNAKQFARAKVSKSGELDINKVWKYKLSDDLFMQTTTVPNGKNHGMIMMIDMSSSMSDNIAGTIEQVLCMSMFCRKVGIPFDVYSFINNCADTDEFVAAGLTTDFKKIRTAPGGDKVLSISDSHFRLQQLLNNKMGFSEYNRAVKNLIVLANAFKNCRNYYSWGDGPSIPSNMHLSGTPLDDGVIVLNEVARKFRAETKVEVLTTIVLTDGEGNRNLRFWDDKSTHSLPYEVTNIVIEDPKSKKSVAFNNLSDTTLPLLDLYKKNTDSRVIGYYLMTGTNNKAQIESRYNFYTRGTKIAFSRINFEKQYSEQFSAERFFAIEGIRGYDSYYMLPGTQLEIKDTTIESVMGKKNGPKSLLAAFKKSQNSKLISRVFVRKFIQGIS